MSRALVAAVRRLLPSPGATAALQGALWDGVDGRDAFERWAELVGDPRALPMLDAGGVDPLQHCRWSCAYECFHAAPNAPEQTGDRRVLRDIVERAVSRRTVLKGTVATLGTAALTGLRPGAVGAQSPAASPAVAGTAGATEAAGTKIGKSTVGRICLGKTPVNLDYVEVLARVFNLQPWQLLVPGLNPANLPALPTAGAAEVERLNKMAELAQQIVDMKDGAPPQAPDQGKAFNDATRGGQFVPATAGRGRRGAA